MPGLALRWLLNAFALWVVSEVVPGIHADGVFATLIAALVLGILNALVRPFFLLLTLGGALPVALDLYANIRPAKSLEGIRSHYKDIDIMVFQIRPGAANGTSSRQKRSHGERRKCSDTSSRSRGMVRSDW